MSEPTPTRPDPTIVQFSSGLGTRTLHRTIDGKLEAHGFVAIGEAEEWAIDNGWRIVK